MWQAGTTCYSTKTEALQAIAATQAGLVLQHGSVAHVVTVSAVGEDGIEYSLVPIGGGSSTTSQVLIAPQPCVLMTSEDVTPIVWAIVAGWLAIYGIKALWGSRHDA
jgi:hypothetical protein